MIEVLLSTKERIKDGLGGYEESILNDNRIHLGDMIFDNTKEVDNTVFYMYSVILNKKYNGIINCRELGDIVLVNGKEYELIKAIDFGNVYILSVRSDINA